MEHSMIDVSHFLGGTLHHWLMDAATFGDAEIAYCEIILFLFIISLFFYICPEIYWYDTNVVQIHKDNSITVILLPVICYFECFKQTRLMNIGPDRKFSLFWGLSGSLQ